MTRFDVAYLLSRPLRLSFGMTHLQPEHWPNIHLIPDKELSDLTAIIDSRESA